MALFTPEINTTGGSSVSAFSPPVKDYSGIGDIGKILSTLIPEKPELSAAERESLEFKPLTDAYSVADEIRSQKGDAAADVFIRTTKINFLKNNPNLAGKLKTFEETLAGLGVEENAYEKTVNMSIEAFQKTNEGKLKTQVRLNQYTDEGGNVNSIGMKSALYADAMEYNAYTSKVDKMKIDVEMKQATKDDLLAVIVTGFKEQYDDTTSQILQSKSGMERTIALAREGTADTPAMLTNAFGILQAEEANRKSVLKQKLLQSGIVKTDSEIDDLMKQANPSLYYNKAAIEAVSTLDKKYIDQINDRSLATMVTKMPPGAASLAVTAPNTMQLYIQNGILSVDEVGKLREDTRNAIYTPNVEMVPTLPWQNVNSSPSMLPEDYSPSNLSSNDKAAVLDMFNPETKQFVEGSTEATKVDVMNKTKGYLELYKKGTIGKTIPGDIQAVALANAYAIQAVTTQLETDGNTKNINLIFGDKAFTFIEDMMKSDPTIGSSLAKQASVYAQFESRKQVEAFNKLYIGQIQGVPENSPFTLEVEGNNLTFKIKPEFEDDQYIKIAKQKNSFVMGRGISTKLPENTDTFSIFTRWAKTGFSGVPAAGSGQPENMVEKIKNIQLIYRNSFRLPQDHGEKVREYILNQVNSVGLR
jgi:hypothetical protein